MKNKRSKKKKRNYHSVNRGRKRPPIMTRLRQLIGDGSKLPSNHLSFRREATRQAIAPGPVTLKSAPRETRARYVPRYVLLDEVDSVWQTISEQFERAVLDGDADWFKRQGRDIEHGDRRADQEKNRRLFEEEVARLLIIDGVPERMILTNESMCFNLRYDAGPLTNEEKRTIRDLEWSGCTHAVIEDEINKRYKRTDSGDYVAASKGRGALVVEWTLDEGKTWYSCRFKNRRCARECVRSVAKGISQGQRFLG